MRSSLKAATTRFTVIRFEVEAELLDPVLDLAGWRCWSMRDTFNEVIMTYNRRNNWWWTTVPPKAGSSWRSPTSTSTDVRADLPCPRWGFSTPSLCRLQPLSRLSKFGWHPGVGYDNISVRPQFCVDGIEWDNAAEDPANWVTSPDSLFTTDAEGQLQSSHIVELIVVTNVESHSPSSRSLVPCDDRGEIRGGATRFRRSIPASWWNMCSTTAFQPTGSPDAPCRLTSPPLESVGSSMASQRMLSKTPGKAW